MIIPPMSAYAILIDQRDDLARALAKAIEERDRLRDRNIALEARLQAATKGNV